jgi:hypothetical protein
LLVWWPLPRPRITVQIHWRRSRMVAISLYGSGEGLG